MVVNRADIFRASKLSEIQLLTITAEFVVNKFSIKTDTPI